MSGIFISYRREDSEDLASALYRDLIGRYGDDQVFMDMHSLEGGLRWDVQLGNTIRTANVLIVLIGEKWLTVLDKTNRKRLNNPEDQLRKEIAIGLGSEGVRVLPLLVEGTTMPTSHDLPSELKPLHKIEAKKLDNAYWKEGFDRLTDLLDDLVHPQVSEAVEPEPKEVLSVGFGPMHNKWLRAPALASGLALVYFAIVVLFSWAVGVHRDITAPSGTAYTGFLNSHWPPLFLLAAPGVPFLVAWLFRLLDRALGSLDQIILPRSSERPPFVVWLADQLRTSWKRWILPVSVSLALGLTLVADGRDILSPLRLFQPSNDHDWSTVASNPDFHEWPAVASIPDSVKESKYIYFLFNVAAFSLQVLLAYLGFLLLAVVSYLFFLVGSKGLGGRDYTVRWDYEDRMQRAGLWDLDKVFLVYVVTITLSIFLASWSVWSNETHSDSGVDIGSAILTVGNLVLLPAAFAWIIVPYWIKFPRVVPPALAKRGVQPPKPWPLGAPVLSWGLVLLAVLAELVLIYLAWDVVKKLMGLS